MQIESDDTCQQSREHDLCYAEVCNCYASITASCGSASGKFGGGPAVLPGDGPLPSSLPLPLPWQGGGTARYSGISMHAHMCISGWTFCSSPHGAPDMSKAPSSKNHQQQQQQPPPYAPLPAHTSCRKARANSALSTTPSWLASASSNLGRRGFSAAAPSLALVEFDGADGGRLAGTLLGLSPLAPPLPMPPSGLGGLWSLCRSWSCESTISRSAWGWWCWLGLRVYHI